MTTELESNELDDAQAEKFRAEMAQELWGNGAAGDPPPAKAEPQINEPPNEPQEGNPSDKEPQQDAESPQEKEDPWEGVSPALKAQFEQMQNTVQNYDTMATRLKQAESRIGGITNELHEAKKAAAKAKKAKEEAPTQEEIDAAAKSKAQWDDLREEFPEWANAMDSRLTAERAEIEKKLSSTKGLQEKIENLEGLVNNNPSVAASVQALRKEINNELVSIRHPGWENKVKSKEFGDFFNTLSQNDQKKAYSDRPSDAIYLLDLYERKKADLSDGNKPKNITEQRKKRLKESELPSKGHTRLKAKSDSDMSDDEYRRKISQDWDSL